MHQLNQRTGIKDCFYHLSSNNWKRIQEFGLQQRYDEEFALSLRMLSAIVFLPPNGVIIQGFEELVDHVRKVSVMEIQIIYSNTFMTPTLVGIGEMLRVGN